MVDGRTMPNICSRRRRGWDEPDCAFASVRSEDDDRSDGRLESSVQVSEALDVEHVHFVDEQNARHELGNALVDVLVHNLVYLLAQLICEKTTTASLKPYKMVLYFHVRAHTICVSKN